MLDVGSQPFVDSAFDKFGLSFRQIWTQLSTGLDSAFDKWTQLSTNLDSAFDKFHSLNLDSAFDKKNITYRILIRIPGYSTSF